jgi:transcriptional regulator with XRE-family HTH domain
MGERIEFFQAERRAMKGNNELGDRIRAQRKSMGWTLRDLAERLGVSVMTVQRIETGKVSPSVVMLQDIAHALEKPLNGFLPDEGSPVRIFGRQNVPAADNGHCQRVDIAPAGLISNDLTISLRDCQAGTVIGPRQTNAMESIHVLDGEQELLYRGRKVILGPGDTVVFDASFKHSITSLTDSKALVFVRNTA